jgi:ribosomal protein L35
MKKLKLRKSVQDRIKVTATGKLLRRVAGQKHLKIHRRSTNKRRGAKLVGISGHWKSKISKLLGL